MALVYPPQFKSHAQKVCRLYKEAMRNIEAYYVARHVIRYHQVLLRARFDENNCVSDPKDQRRLLWMGREELFKVKHPLQCAKFAQSTGIAGGVAYDRVQVIPDWVLDYWHPLEKAQYPYYFKRREARKCEFIQHWNAGKIY